MTTIPVTFALHGDDLMHVNDVANGLACGCVCPSCGDRMVAKHGAITIHHFAHEGGSDCAGGLQTTLHLAAKAVLSKERRMVLPALILTATAHDAQGIAHTVSKEALPARSVVFDEVTEEKRLGDIVPDLICKIGGRALLVEIAVTHFVDEIKREKIRALGVACVEIDLSTMVSVWNWDTLKNAVVDGIAYKAWIENPKHDELRAELQREAQEKAAIADRDRLEAMRTDVPGLVAAIKWLEEFITPGAAQRESDRLNEAGSRERIWLSAAKLMNLEWNNLPDYIDITVPGENAFLVARKVWQADLYAALIASKRNGFSVARAALWSARLQAQIGFRPELALLRENIKLLTPDQKNALPNAHEAVTSYLTALVDLGYVKAEGTYYYLLEGAPHRD
jgi:hypothetical protein